MKALKIEIPIYNCNIILKFTNNFKKYMKKKGTHLSKSYNSAKGLCMGIDKTHTIFIMIKKRRKYCWDTITHEALHATNEILNARGVGTTHKNDEAQTYLLGFIINKVQNYIGNQNEKD